MSTLGPEFTGSNNTTNSTYHTLDSEIKVEIETEKVIIAGDTEYAAESAGSTIDSEATASVSIFDNLNDLMLGGLEKLSKAADFVQGQWSALGNNISENSTHVSQKMGETLRTAAKNVPDLHEHTQGVTNAFEGQSEKLAGVLNQLAETAEQNPGAATAVAGIAAATVAAGVTWAAYKGVQGIANSVKRSRAGEEASTSSKTKDTHTTHSTKKAKK